MGEIITFQDDRKGMYSQIKYPDKSRILIGFAQTGLRISKLSFGGMLPTKVLFELKKEYFISNLETLKKLQADSDEDFKRPVPLITDFLLPFNSSGEAVSKLKEIFGE